MSGYTLANRFRASGFGTGGESSRNPAVSALQWCCPVRVVILELWWELAMPQSELNQEANYQANAKPLYGGSVMRVVMGCGVLF